MRILLLLSVLPCLFAASHSVKSPVAIENFIPKNFKVLQFTEGELNADGKLDYAVVVERQASDTKPAQRRLLIMVSDSEAEGGLKIAQQYWRFIPLPDHQNADPFAYLGINNGLIEIKFTPANAGRSHTTYTFKPEGKRFVLNSLQRYQVKPATGMFKETIFNVSEGQRESTSGSMSSPRHMKKVEKFSAEKTWTPCRIDDPLNFEP